MAFARPRTPPDKVARLLDIRGKHVDIREVQLLGPYINKLWLHLLRRGNALEPGPPRWAPEQIHCGSCAPGQIRFGSEP